MSGMAVRMWSACVRKFITFFRRNWTSARQNQMEASIVENVCSLKWLTDGGVAAGEEESAGEEATESAGMVKARSSAPGLPMWRKLLRLLKEVLLRGLI